MTGFGIRGKLLTSYVLVFLMLIVCGGGGAYMYARPVVEQSVELQLHSATGAILGTVRAGADLAVRNYLKAVAEKARDVVAYEYARYQSGAITEAQAQANAADLLLRMRIGRSGYIYCLNEKGVVVVHPVAAMRDKDVSEYDFVREQTRLQEGFLQYDWRNPGETHSRPKALHMTRFEPWGWIISASAYREEFNNLLDVNLLRDAVLAHRIGESGYTFIMNGKGELLLHPVLEPGDMADLRDGGGRLFVREILQNRSGRITYLWRNPGEQKYREKIMVYTYLADYDWIVAASGYVDEVYAPLTRLRHFVLVWALAATMVVALASLYASAGITGPLRRLKEQVRLGAGGDLSVRVVPEAHDEIADLANYFNRLMGNLEGHTLRLGQLVEARTAELRRLNADYLQELERRTATEEEARSRFAFLRALMDAIPNPIYYRDFHGRFVDCNNSFAVTVLGSTREDVRGRPASDFPDVFPPDVVAADMRDDDALRQLGGTRASEQVLHCAGGVLRHYGVIKSLFGAGGVADGGIIGVMTDLTVRRRGDDIRLLLEQVLEDADAGRLLLDGDGVIRYANPAIAELLGWPRVELAGRRLADTGLMTAGGGPGAGLVGGPDSGVNGGADELRKACATGTAWSGTVELRRGDGASFGAACRLTPLRDASGVIGYLLRVRVPGESETGGAPGGVKRG